MKIFSIFHIPFSIYLPMFNWKIIKSKIQWQMGRTKEAACLTGVANGKWQIERGFSLAELVIIIAISIIMLALGTVSLLNSQEKASLSTTIETFIADLKEQQVKAMVGDTEGTGSANDYGINFETTQYTLFRNTYVAGNSQNFSVPLPSTIEATSPRITFTKGSGETTPVSITFTNTATNEIRTITINKYGTVVGIN
jgi:type II secretory pathway pseudopilin PulG